MLPQILILTLFTITACTNNKKIDHFSEKIKTLNKTRKLNKPFKISKRDKSVLVSNKVKFNDKGKIIYSNYLVEDTNFEINGLKITCQKKEFIRFHNNDELAGCSLANPILIKIVNKNIEIPISSKVYFIIINNKNYLKEIRLSRPIQLKNKLLNQKIMSRSKLIFNLESEIEKIDTITEKELLVNIAKQKFSLSPKAKIYFNKNKITKIEGLAANQYLTIQNKEALLEEKSSIEFYEDENIKTVHLKKPFSFRTNNSIIHLSGKITFHPNKMIHLFNIEKESRFKHNENELYLLKFINQRNHKFYESGFPSKTVLGRVGRIFVRGKLYELKDNREQFFYDKLSPKKIIIAKNTKIAIKIQSLIVTIVAKKNTQIDFHPNNLIKELTLASNIEIPIKGKKIKFKENQILKFNDKEELML